MQAGLPSVADGRPTSPISTNMSTSSGTPESWISSFCSLLGHEYFAEVSEEFIEDDFNLTGLQNQVTMYKEALEVSGSATAAFRPIFEFAEADELSQMILDVEPEDEDEEEEEEEEEEENDSADGMDRAGTRAHAERRHHSRIASDLSVIESSAEMLYGLIHQRFICSRAGIQQMSEKYELGHFGVCPRTNCNQARTLPVGLTDIPGEDTVKLFCPSCLDVYVPPNSRFQTVDGAFFGRTFGALFLLTFPEYDLSKHGADAISNIPTSTTTSLPHSATTVSSSGRMSVDESLMINGVYARNTAPGLGRAKIYEPRIYGFRVSEMARSGPRMQWLRDKPEDITELDEARRFLEEQADSEDEDETMSINNGRAVVRRRPPGNGAARQDQNGSPMAIEPNGAESEL